MSASMPPLEDTLLEIRTAARGRRCCLQVIYTIPGLELHIRPRAPLIGEYIDFAFESSAMEEILDMFKVLSWWIS
jgi:hypothetical protein